ETRRRRAEGRGDAAPPARERRAERESADRRRGDERERKRVRLPIEAQDLEPERFGDETEQPEKEGQDQRPRARPGSRRRFGCGAPAVRAQEQPARDEGRRSEREAEIVQRPPRREKSRESERARDAAQRAERVEIARRPLPPGRDAGQDRAEGEVGR